MGLAKKVECDLTTRDDLWKLTTLVAFRSEKSTNYGFMDNDMEMPVAAASVAIIEVAMA